MHFSRFQIMNSKFVVCLTIQKKTFSLKNCFYFVQVEVGCFIIYLNDEMFENPVVSINPWQGLQLIQNSNYQDCNRWIVIFLSMFLLFQCICFIIILFYLTFISLFFFCCLFTINSLSIYLYIICYNLYNILLFYLSIYLSIIY